MATPQNRSRQDERHAFFSWNFPLSSMEFRLQITVFFFRGTKKMRITLQTLNIKLYFISRPPVFVGTQSKRIDVLIEPLPHFNDHMNHIFLTVRNVAFSNASLYLEQEHVFTCLKLNMSSRPPSFNKKNHTKKMLQLNWYISAHFWGFWEQKPQPRKNQLIFVEFVWLEVLLPWNWTWNLKMEVWKMIFLFSWVILRFHVKFQGCSSFYLLNQLVFRAYWPAGALPRPQVDEIAWPHGVPGTNLKNHPGFFREEKVEKKSMIHRSFCGEKSFTHLGCFFRNGSSLKDLGHSRCHQGLAPPKFPVYIFGIFGGWNFGEWEKNMANNAWNESLRLMQKIMLRGSNWCFFGWCW